MGPNRIINECIELQVTLAEDDAMRHLYLISFTRNESAGFDQITRIWPKDYLQISENTAILADEDITLNQIVTNLGMGDSDDQPTGIVIHLDLENVSGYLPQSMIDWMLETRRDA